jgi:Na+/melibiose symporter-like transporter
MAFVTIVPGSKQFHKRSQAHKSRIGVANWPSSPFLCNAKSKRTNRADSRALLRGFHNDLGVPLRTLRMKDSVDGVDIRRIRAIFIGSVGNLVEWYDFYAYAAFALYFAGAFFPTANPVVQQLDAAVLFAVGFLVRPLGGWMFGQLADNYGRRNALTLSVALMCFGSLMVAATPTYQSIGLAAPIVLAIARIIQGLSLDGTSATYLSEVADERNRDSIQVFSTLR